jgi:pimeloyl-ACP methyl ester carboxylesterase
MTSNQPEGTGYPGYDRIPYMIAFRENAIYKDTYGGELGRVTLKAHLLKPERASDTVIVFMHPIGGGEYLPMPVGLAKAGYHVIYCNSRYPGADYALQMEKVVLDLAACVRDAKQRLGYQRVVLAGWSGGGSLSAFYQAEAESPSVKATAAGDPLDLAQAGLIAADALLLLAAHVSRAVTLTENLDASIADESLPQNRLLELDLYDPKNRNQPPYSAEFLARYRIAQIARNRRITAWVCEKLEWLRANGRPNEEFAFVVHGTLADPRWLDPTVDPNDRVPGTCFLGEPRLVNNGPVGLARFCTLRSWLSQWSFDRSNADGVRSLSRVSAPVLVVGNSADNICTPSHTQRLFDAVGHADKERAEIKGASHYYIGQRAQLEEAVSLIDNWLVRHQLD